MRASTQSVPRPARRLRPAALPVALAALAALSCAHATPAPTFRPEPPAGSTAAPPRSEETPIPEVTTHTVAPGETLWRITRAYGADLDEVIAVNGLEESARIHAGQTLVIPNPHRLPPPGPLLAEQAPSALPGEPGDRGQVGPAPERPFWEDEGENEAPPPGPGPKRRPGREPGEPALLRWPLYGTIHSGFGRRGRRHHDGVDIEARRGDPIHVAADGWVVFSGSRGAYGRTVVVDHGDGLSTLYAHADVLKVKRGEPVRAGQTIARVGRSGNARGAHLHFEVRIDGQPVNPLEHLPLESARAGAAR